MAGLYQALRRECSCEVCVALAGRAEVATPGSLLHLLSECHRTVRFAPRIGTNENRAILF